MYTGLTVNLYRWKISPDSRKDFGICFIAGKMRLFSSQRNDSPLIKEAFKQAKAFLSYEHRINRYAHSEISRIQQHGFSRLSDALNSAVVNYNVRSGKEKFLLS